MSQKLAHIFFPVLVIVIESMRSRLTLSIKVDRKMNKFTIFLQVKMDKITNFWQTSWSYKGVQKRPDQKRSGHKKVFENVLVLKRYSIASWSQIDVQKHIGHKKQFQKRSCHKKRCIKNVLVAKGSSKTSWSQKCVQTRPGQNSKQPYVIQSVCCLLFFL